MLRIRSQRKAMTLFELTAVVAIAVILIGLAVLSMQSLLVSTKVSAVREEQRTLANALQNYQLDYSVYPDTQLGLQSLQNMSYLQLPTDPFQRGDHNFVYLATGSASTGALLISPGPDKDLDIPVPLLAFISLNGIDVSLLEPAEKEEVEGAALRLAPAPEQYDSALLENLLRSYIQQNQYDPNKGKNGDIITIVK